MKKHKFVGFPSNRVRGLKVLSGMNIDFKTKRKLQEQAKKWLKYIKFHSEEIKHDDMYHEGEMSFIKFFFLSKIKKQRTSNCLKLRIF